MREAGIKAMSVASYSIRGEPFPLDEEVIMIAWGVVHHLLDYAGGSISRSVTELYACQYGHGVSKESSGR